MYTIMSKFADMRLYASRLNRYEMLQQCDWVTQANERNGSLPKREK